MTKREGKIWIEGMQTALADETLAATDIREKLGGRTSVNVLPDVWVIKIGGQSIMDRGREAVYPILEELRAARRQNIEFIIGAGGGTRARHVYALGLDLDLPTGIPLCPSACIRVRSTIWAMWLVEYGVERCEIPVTGSCQAFRR